MDTKGTIHSSLSDSTTKMATILIRETNRSTSKGFIGDAAATVNLTWILGAEHTIREAWEVHRSGLWEVLDELHAVALEDPKEFDWVRTPSSQFPLLVAPKGHMMQDCLAAVGRLHISSRENARIREMLDKIKGVLVRYGWDFTEAEDNIVWNFVESDHSQVVK